MFAIGAAHAIIPAVPRGLLVMDGINAAQVRAALHAFCKSHNCTVGYRDDIGPYWRIYVGKQSLGSVGGPCGSFRWCLQTYEFPQADAFWTLAAVAAMKQAFTTRGAVAYELVCDGNAHQPDCVDGQRKPPESQAKVAYADQQLSSERSVDMRYQYGDFWILGLPRASWQAVQLVIEKFCAANACYALLNYIPANERFMFNIPGQHLHVPKPRWFIYSAVDNAWLGILDENCPVQHADAYCLHFTRARGDVFWNHVRVARLRAGFDKAGIATDPMECWPARLSGELGPHDYCRSPSSTVGR